MMNRLFALLALCGALFLGGLTARAEDPAPPAAPKPAEAPAETPKPAETEKEKETPKRKEEDEEKKEEAKTTTASATAPVPSAFATRVSAALTALRGQGPAVQQLAQRDQTIAQLRNDLATRDQTIQRLTAENAQFRADQTALEASLRTLEGERTNVRETVAALGFDQTKLPAQGSIEDASENTLEGLQAKLKAETDSDKRSEIAAQMIALRNKAAAKKTV